MVSFRRAIFSSSPAVAVLSAPYLSSINQPGRFIIRKRFYGPRDFFIRIVRGNYNLILWSKPSRGQQEQIQLGRLREFYCFNGTVANMMKGREEMVVTDMIWL